MRSCHATGRLVLDSRIQVVRGGLSFWNFPQFWTETALPLARWCHLPTQLGHSQQRILSLGCAQFSVLTCFSIDSPQQSQIKLNPGVVTVRGVIVVTMLQRLWSDSQGQDVAEYAVMLAVILAIAVGTIRLIGARADNVFSSVGSAIQ